MLKLFQSLQTLWDKSLTWLGTPRDSSLTDKPSKTALFMDRFSVGAMLAVFLLLLFLQLKIGFAWALLGAGLTILGFYVFLRGMKKTPLVQSIDQKVWKSRYFISRSKQVERMERESETPSEIGLEDQLQNKDQRWKGHIVIGSVFFVVGWLWSGGWGLYFTVIGALNLVFAGICLLYEWKSSRLVSE